MLIRHARQLIALMVVIIAVAAAPAYSARMNGVMVVPARYTIVQFSFDIVALRGVELVSYEKADSGDVVLYRWDWMASQWQSISYDELANFSFMKSSPDYVYLVGTDSDVPSLVDAATAGATKVVRIKTLNIIQVVNILNETMNFNQAEWEALARKHKLKIKDWNYERRRWGRYGRPKSRVNENKTTHVVEIKSVDEPEVDVEVVEAVEVKETETSDEKNNPFEEMERELDRMSKEKAAKGVELIPTEPPPKPAPLPEENPDLKKDVSSEVLAPDGDLVYHPVDDLPPEDK